MLHKTFALLSISLFAVLVTAFSVGCGTSESGHLDQTAAVKTVTLHIDGFKKSKSGAT